MPDVDIVNYSGPAEDDAEPDDDGGDDGGGGVEVNEGEQYDACNKSNNLHCHSAYVWRKKKNTQLYFGKYRPNPRGQHMKVDDQNKVKWRKKKKEVNEDIQYL